MSGWRLLQDDGAGAADGPALDEALLHGFHREGDGTSQPVVRLYTYRSHCALIGRHQSLAAEVDTDACDELGIDIGRRLTGGGAIIMGSDQLGIAVAMRAPVQRSPRDVLRQCAEGVIAALERLGLEARFRGKNDLEVGGRKIAGLGLHLDQHGGLLFHASVLADLDVEVLVRALRIPGAKLSAHGIGRVQDRVTTVSRELRTSMTGPDLRPFLLAGFVQALGPDVQDGEPTVRERVVAADLTERYASPDWLDQRGGRDAVHSSALVRTPEGLLRIYVGVQGSALSSVMVTGDMSFLPDSVNRAEALLRWRPAEPDLIADTLREVLEPEVFGVGPDPIAAGVWAAAREAMERSGSLPVRLSGSCYFPDPITSQPSPDLAATETA